jgi:galactoside O-acetyltransferase
MYFSKDQLAEMGVTIGENTLISNLVRFYGCQAVIGSNVRIDDFCIVKGNIQIGDYVHIGAFSILAGGGAKITIGSRVGISSRGSLFTGTEDFSSNKRGHPTMSPGCSDVRDVIVGEIKIEDDVIIGSLVTILPNVRIGNNVSLGANLIIARNIPSNCKIISNSRLVKIS